MALNSSRILQISSWIGILLQTQFQLALAFIPSPHQRTLVQPFTYHASQLYSSNKKKNIVSSGKGFGKQQEKQKGDDKNVSFDDKDGLFVSIDETKLSSPKSTSYMSSSSNLSNIDMISSSSSLSSPASIDKPVEERTKDILRQKFGLTSMEEKLNKLEELDRNELIKKKSLKIQKAVQKKEEESSFISSIPPDVLSGISTILKIGTGLSVVLFVLAGIGITWEAWIVSTKPENSYMSPQLDAFITQVVEPNFTLGLFVLLSFSIALGLLTTAQLGNASAVYKEKE